MPDAVKDYYKSNRGIKWISLELKIYTTYVFNSICIREVCPKICNKTLSMPLLQFYLDGIWKFWFISWSNDKKSQRIFTHFIRATSDSTSDSSWSLQGSLRFTYKSEPFLFWPTKMKHKFYKISKPKTIVFTWGRGSISRIYLFIRCFYSCGHQGKDQFINFINPHYPSHDNVAGTCHFRYYKRCPNT